MANRPPPSRKIEEERQSEETVQSRWCFAPRGDEIPNGGDSTCWPVYYRTQARRREWAPILRHIRAFWCFFPLQPVRIKSTGFLRALLVIIIGHEKDPRRLGRRPDEQHLSVATRLSLCLLAFESLAIGRFECRLPQARAYALPGSKVTCFFFSNLTQVPVTTRVAFPADEFSIPRRFTKTRRMRFAFLHHTKKNHSVNVTEFFVAW